MFFRRIVVFVFALALLFAITAARLDAQSITQGNIRGTVSDPSGAVIPGATVTLKSTRTGSVQARTTNNSGFYEFPLVTPGPYVMSITAPSYQTVSQNVTVSLGQVTSTNVKLAVATSSTTVEVMAEGSALHPNPEVSTTMSGQQIEYTPNGAGDLSYIAQTAPGANMNTQAGYGNFSTFGLGGTTNNFTVNSAPENDPFLSLNNSGATNVLLGQNDVSEATVVNNGYSGQYFSSGANVNYVTKSGTNSYHGNAAWLWNGTTLNANGYFNKQNSPPTPRGFVNDNQWAASVGGPIKKDKAFFFVDTEGLYLLIPVSRSINLPTAAFETATLASVSAKQPTQVSLYQNMFNFWNGAPGAASAANTLANGGCADFTGAGFGAGNPCAVRLNSTVKGATHEWLITGRYDQNLGNNDKMYIHYRGDRGVQATYTDPLNPIFNATSFQPQYEGQLQWAHTASVNVVNSFTVNGSYYRAIFKHPDQAATLAAQPVEVSFSGSALRAIGNDYNIFPQGRNVTQYGFVDDLSWTMGKHAVKFGGNYSRYDITDFDPGIGSLPAVVGETMTDFFNGVGTNYTQSFPARLTQPVALWNLGFYGEDRWRIKRNFDLTLTLRTDYNSNPVCQTNCYNRLAGDFLGIDHSVTTPYNQTVQAGLHQALPGSYHPWSVQPRVGFSYSPMPNTVISGGAGLFSSIIPAFYVDSLMNNLPSDPAFIVSGVPFGPTTPGNGQSTTAAGAAALTQGFANGATWNDLNNSVTAATGGLSGFSPPNFFNAASDIHVPRTQEWNLQLQQGFGTKTVFKVQYVGNHGIWQQINNGGLNAYCGTTVAATTLISSGGTAAPCLSPGQTFVGLPGSPIDQRFLQMTEVSTGYTSNYNGLTTSLLRRMSSLQFQLNYTWSHALDFVSNGGNQLPFNFNTNNSISNPQNPFNVRENMYGNADYDVRNNFSANAVYTSPKMKGLVGVLGDWTIGGTLFWHSGLPFTVIDSGTGSLLNSYGYAGTQVGASNLATFATQTGGSAIGCGSQFAQLNSPPCPGMAANFAADALSFGNQRRNQVRGPLYFNTDLNLLKNFRVPAMGEAGMVSFGVTFFNVFNHPNFDQPVGDVADPSFGTIVNTVNSPTSIYGSFLNADASPRLIQTQIKFTF